ncbi:unnamed protein product, partial [Linum tenue]
KKNFYLDQVQALDLHTLTPNPTRPVLDPRRRSFWDQPEITFPPANLCSGRYLFAVLSLPSGSLSLSVAVLDLK